MDGHDDPAGPAGLLIEAIIARDGAGVLSALADEITISIPPLSFTCRGRAEAFGAIEAVLTAFPDLRYTVRSRYVAPGEVTDEILLTGTHAGPLLGIAATGRPGRVLARLRMAHDGQAVSTLSLWADRSSLREAVSATGGNAAGSSDVVAALRATLPPGESRLILGRPREPVVGLPEPHPEPAPPAPSRTTIARGPEVKAPVPRRTRRRRATAVGALMAATTVVLVAWVARGTLSTTPSVRTMPITAASAVPPSTTPSAIPTATPTPAPPAAQQIEEGVTLSGNTYDLSTDVLFGKDSSRLTSHARNVLARLAGRVRTQVDSGEIIVTGYTDSSGSSEHNTILSMRRAKAVTGFLERELRDLPGLRITPHGAGESDPVADNATEQGRILNRRVTVELPAVSQVRPSPGSTAR